MKSLLPLGIGRTIFLLLSLLLLLPVATGTLRQVSAQSDESGEDSLYKHLSVFTEVLSLIQRGYVDETSLTRLFEGALDGTTDALDPLATYVPAPNVEDYEAALAIGSGRSGLSVAREAGITFVIAVQAGSPGHDAGIESGDVMTEIGDQSTREMALWELQTLLSQESGALAVELLRRGQSVDVELRLGTFEKVRPGVRLERGVPVLRVSEFAADTADLIRTLLLEEPVKSSQRLIVDVRGAAGGDVRAAYEVASLFSSGTLGELRGRDESLETFSSENEPVWQGRMAVLSDRSCQGASEVFVAAVKESPGIDTVGSRTFGHAGRQATRELSTGATLFYTDAFYAGSDGAIIDRGLEAEVVVRATRQSLRGADDGPEDPALTRALDLVLEQEQQAA